MSSSGFNFGDVKQHKTLGNGTLSGALAVARGAAFTNSSSNPSRVYGAGKTKTPKQSIGIGSKQHASSGEIDTGASLEERETSKNSSQNNEGSLENIVEQEDDAIELQIGIQPNNLDMSDDRVDEDVSLPQVDVNFNRHEHAAAGRAAEPKSRGEAK